MLGDNDIQASGLSGIFTWTRPGHFGMTINRPWNAVISNGHRTFAQHVLHGQNRFGIGNVG